MRDTRFFPVSHHRVAGVFDGLNVAYTTEWANELQYNPKQEEGMKWKIT